MIDAVDRLMLGGDLSVRRLGFGAMRITGAWDVGANRKVLRPPSELYGAALELGVNLINTADSYGPGVGENLIAEALHPYPSDLVIATKGGTRRSGPYQWSLDGRPSSLREACEGSLRRLRLDRIDLYQLHEVAPQVPLGESVGALRELQGKRKVRQIGLSNVDGDQLGRARI